MGETAKKEIQFFYLKLIEKNATQGRAIDRVAGALAYYIAKRDGLPHTMQEISGKLETTKWSLFKTYKGVVRKLNLRYSGCDFESLVFKCNNGLKLQERTIGRAVEILRQMNNLTNMPNVKVATALFLAGVENGEEISQRRIANVCGCSESAVRELCRVWRDRINAFMILL